MKVGLLALAACAPVPEPLESFRISAGGEDGASVVGLATVTGADRDWTLEITPDDGGEPVEVAIDSPTRNDASQLDGRSLALELPYDELTALALRDDDGPVWVANDAGLAATLGVNVAYGASVGSERRDGHGLRHHAIRFGGDEEIELLAGETASLVADGVRWRVGAIAAWEVRSGLFGASRCGPADLLSFEMFRVDDEVEPTVEIRPAGERRVGSGCDAI